MSTVSSFVTICPDPGAAEGGGQGALVSLTSATHTTAGQKLKCKMVKADIPTICLVFSGVTGAQACAFSFLEIILWPGEPLLLHSMPPCSIV